MRIQTELRARTGTVGVLAAGALWFLWELVKEAVFGFLNTSLAELFGMSDFTIQQAYPLLATYGPPVVLMSSVMVLVIWAYKLGGVETPISTSPSLVDPVGQEDFSPAIKPESDPSYIRIEDALNYLINESQWGHEEPGSASHGAALLLRQAARDSEITIHGREEISRGSTSEFRHVWIRIPQPYRRA